MILWRKNRFPFSSIRCNQKWKHIHNNNNNGTRLQFQNINIYPKHHSTFNQNKRRKKKEIFVILLFSDSNDLFLLFFSFVVSVQFSCIVIVFVERAIGIIYDAVGKFIFLFFLHSLSAFRSKITINSVNACQSPRQRHSPVPEYIH